MGSEDTTAIQIFEPEHNIHSQVAVVSPSSGISIQWLPFVDADADAGRTPNQCFGRIIIKNSVNIKNGLPGDKSLPTLKQIQARFKNRRNAFKSTWNLQVNADLTNIFKGSIISDKAGWDAHVATHGSDAMMTIGIHASMNTAGE